MRPKISVCIATLNGEKYIKDQLVSVLNQIDENDEVVISDDGSSDKTLDIINSMGDHRVIIFNNQHEHGFTKNFENALKHSTGDIIFLCDQDDVWTKDKVEISTLALKDCDLVVSDCYITNEYLTILNQSHFKVFGVTPGFWSNFLRPRYVGACISFKRHVLVKSLPFPKNQFLAPHDYWITLIAEYFFKVKLIHTPLIYYRRHSNNASTGGTRSYFSYIKRISIRAYVLLNIFWRTYKN